ncbi:hypothetical protein BS47DRAFT_461759 [Hydnum rufescens UP504]|uniref:ubiquitinyl hydrolase 1 n=1 Tax=Hydnum rufescens UP504 TaxID=1448309 RepID=A0A9P6AHY8_9AGAM|nr:hypothetical protein BS47DRAFT_461759 [Hydnum rufescens UP504]
MPALCSNKGFCMMCRFRTVAIQAIGTSGEGTNVGSSRSFNPSSITSNLKNIAKSLRLGRQEDAHEFLRYSIDAFQRAALYGTDPKLPHSVKETTWVHKLFGGRLRSRVTCNVCKHPSDTFDSILDLSIDVRDRSSVRDALRLLLPSTCCPDQTSINAKNARNTSSLLSNLRSTMHHKF